MDLYNTHQYAEKLNKEHLRKKRWLKVVGILAVIVVFCTVYALILPAITMENQSVDFRDMITNVSLQHRPGNWSEWEDVDGTPLKEHDQLKFTIDYTIPGSILSDDVRSVTYQLPEDISVVKAESGTLLDSFGKDIGTYSISEDGKITITFCDEYVERNSSGQQIVGSIAFESSLDNIEAGDKDIIELPFNDNLKFEIVVKDSQTEQEDLTVEKTAGRIDSKNGTIEYTIVVKSTNGTAGSVELNDVMNNILFDGNFKVTDKSGNEIKNVSPPKVGSSKFNLTLPQMDAGEEYIITYTASIPDKYLNGTIHANNKVTASSKDSEGNKITDEANTNSQMNHSLLKKTGTSTDKDKIVWTVTVNSVGMDIGGWTLSDTFNGVKFEGEVDISPAIDGKNKITLPYTFPEGTDSTYTITYTTSTDKDLGAAQTVNRVDLHNDETDKNISSGNVGAGNWGSRFEPITKSAGSLDVITDGIAEIIWNVKINADQGPITGPWVYTDKLKDNQWFTDKQLDELEALLRSKNLSFSMERLTYGDGKYYGFKITFQDTLEKGNVIDFSYKSTASIKNDDSQELTFRNDANINDKTFSSDSVSLKPIISKFDAANNKTNDTTHDYYDKELNENGTLKWGIKVNIPKDCTDELIITEKLPAGVSLSETGGLQVKADNIFNLTDFVFNNNSASVSNNGFTITAEKQSDNSIKIKIPSDLTKKLQDKVIYFYVNAVINENNNWQEEENDKLVSVFENKVIIENKNGDELGSDSQTQTITKDKNHGIVDKENGEVKNDVIPYSIKINPEGKDLLEGADTIFLKDEIKIELGSWQGDAHLNLVPGSLKVYEMNPDGSKGNALLQDEYPYTHNVENRTENYKNYEVNTLSVKIPDSRPLIVEYKYKITGPIGSVRDISNTASLEGFAPGSGSSDHKLSLKITGSNAIADITATTICKVDADNYNIHLKGAQFKLWRYNSQSGEWESVQGDDGTEILTTGDDGELTVKLAYNTAYKLVEIKAPEGYELDQREFLFSIETSDKTKFPPSKPEYFDGKEFGEGAVIDYPNKKSTTDVTVVKKWIDSEGNDITASKDGEIKFNLYRKGVIIKEGGVQGDATLTGNIRIGNENGNIFREFNETMPIGSEVTFKIVDKSGKSWGEPPIIRNNGKAITPTSKISGDAKIYTYTFTLDSEENVISGYLTKWDVNQYEISGPSVYGLNMMADVPEREYVGTYSINSENGWKFKLSKLPKYEEFDDGTVVAYQYFIDEVSVSGYVVSYNNNNGIEYGVITITNAADKNSDYELPETGGMGTHIYTLSGLLLIAGALMCGYKLRRKSERGAVK